MCVRVCVYVLITLGNEDSCPGKVEVAQNGVEIRESCWPWVRGVVVVWGEVRLWGYRQFCRSCVEGCNE